MMLRLAENQEQAQAEAEKSENVKSSQYINCILIQTEDWQTKSIRVIRVHV